MMEIWGWGSPFPSGIILVELEGHDGTMGQYICGPVSLLLWRGIQFRWEVSRAIPHKSWMCIFGVRGLSRFGAVSGLLIGIKSFERKCGTISIVDSMSTVCGLIIYDCDSCDNH
jgi:hypothetical protein